MRYGITEGRPRVRVDSRVGSLFWTACPRPAHERAKARLFRQRLEVVVERGAGASARALARAAALQLLEGDQRAVGIAGARQRAGEIEAVEGVFRIPTDGLR